MRGEQVCIGDMKLKAEEGTETKLQLEAENGKMHSREQ